MFTLTHNRGFPSCTVFRKGKKPFWILNNSEFESKRLFSQGADQQTCQLMLGMLKEKLARKREEHHNTVLFLLFLGQFYLFLVLWVSVCVCSSRGSPAACPALHRCGWPEAGGSFRCPKRCSQRGPAVGYTSKHVPDIVPALRGSPAEQVCVWPKRNCSPAQR